jgi:prepilin-type N-terminal cleavage/methylation domain-containing protein
MSRRPCYPLSRKHQGFTLLELLIIIVVLGIAASTMTVMSVRSAELSAGMLMEQRALSVANALLDEVRAMPFTPCDPYPSSCATAENMGPEAGETRNGLTPATRFDNVNDYAGFTAPAGTLRDAAGNLISAAIPTVATCMVQVAVVPEVLPTVLAGDALRITVTVSACPGLINPVSVDAVRVRYAPTRWQY